MTVRGREPGGEPVGLLFCCCLPILGLVKAFVLAPLPAMTLFAGCTIISVLSLPYDMRLAYVTIWSSAMIGPKVRMLSLFMLPLPFLAWPVLVAISTLFGGLAGFGCWMAFTVFDAKVPLLGGGVRAMQESVKMVQEFSRITWTTSFEFCERVRDIPAAWDGRVYEIPIYHFFIGLVLLLWGTLIGSVGVVVIATLKLLPLMLRALLEYVRLLGKLEPWWWLFWLFGLILGGALFPPLYVIVVLGGFAYSGLRCAFETLISDSMVSGFFEVFRIIRTVDKESNVLIFGEDSKCSCIPEVADRAPRSHRRLQEIFVDRPEQNSLTHIWDAFFEECVTAGHQAVADGWVTAASCEAMDPGVIIGIPALGVFNILHRSSMKAPKKKMICWQSLDCDEKSRPRNTIADTFWPRILAAKRELTRYMPLSDEELLYLRVKLCSGGGDTSTLGAYAQAVLAKECTRWQRLQHICAEVNRLSLQLSRLREVQARLPGLLSDAAGSAAKPVTYGKSSGGECQQGAREEISGTLARHPCPNSSQQEVPVLSWIQGCMRFAGWCSSSTPQPAQRLESRTIPSTDV